MEEVNERMAKFGELWRYLNVKESLVRQKSKIKWIQDGDLNTSFFHACLAIRRRRNQLVAIKVDNLWVEEATKIKDEINKHLPIFIWRRKVRDRD